MNGKDLKMKKPKKTKNNIAMLYMQKIEKRN
jgi:hypothetical protein